MVAGGRPTAGSQSKAPIDPGGVAPAQRPPLGHERGDKRNPANRILPQRRRGAEKTPTGGPPVPPFGVPASAGLTHASFQVAILPDALDG